MNPDLKAIHDELNSMSPSMCLVKWKHATVNMAVNTVKSCCHNSSRKIEFVDDDLKLHDTSADREIRRQMLEGKKPSDCNFCWSMEETGNYSDRTYWSSQNWMKEFLKEVKEHNSTEALPPSWLELNFSSVCQFKCSYCNPGYSTSWMKELQQHGPYPTTVPHNDLWWFKQEGLIPDPENTDHKLKDKFWSWFEKAVPHVRLLTLTGGEPLLSRDTFRVLDYFLAHPQPQLELAVNSNLCVPEPIWEQFTMKVTELQEKNCVAKIYLHPSLDSWGARAEYIRFGLNLKLFEKNLHYFLEKTTANIVFNCTLNNLSLAGLLDYWKLIVRLKKEYNTTRWISSTTEPLVFPKWQALNLLPDDFVIYLEEVEKYLISELPVVSFHEIEGIRRAKSFLLNKAGVTETDYIDFFKFFREHDRRRKTDFIGTFPELTEFFIECGDKTGGGNEYRAILRERGAYAHFRNYKGSIIPEEVDLKDRFCERPFTHVEIMHGQGLEQEKDFGDVYACCVGWLSKKIGNYLKNDLTTIWNSKEAQDIRKSVLDGSFRYCNKQACPYIQDGSLPKKQHLPGKYKELVTQQKTVLDTLPSHFFLCYDRSCNLSCKSCRNELILFREGSGREMPQRLNERLLKDLFSVPTHRRINLKITGSGDPFASPAFKDLLSRLDGRQFPGLEVELFTNGLLFNRQNWEDLKHLHGHITLVSVSIDAATEGTYRKIRGGNWSQLMNSLDFISNLKREKKIGHFATNFVVQKGNFQEIGSFVRLCESKNVDRINFSFVSDWSTWTPEEFKLQCIWNKDHPYFEDLMQEMRDPVLGSQIVALGPLAPYRQKALRELSRPSQAAEI